MLPILLLAVAAALGATLAMLHFTKKPLPISLGLLHGAFAAAGLLAAIAAGVGGQLAGSWKVSLAILITAALGGFFLFFTYLKKKSLPSAVVLLHGGLAVVGFVLLLIATFG